ncbi:EamA family transporter RarD [Halomonas aquamarina]|uniref:EamA family transporter RarD n=1 Tax=Vreelandella aquamarina TaxID=77097 RepID=A0ACC5VU63_9GAMM|nr:EamA family transporter RarD [Halomonas aquamarina]MBZ5487423.1 EamA family transporter RarD [Halomonas aquamarina]
MQTAPDTALGVALNVAGSIFFALMFAYAPLLHALDGGEIYGWRMLLTFPCLTLFILWRGYGGQITALIRRLARERLFWATRLLGAGLLGVQLWLFMWAPGNGQGLAVSLGYFLMPITMVLIGRLAFGDRLSRLQILASLLALAGATNQLLVSSSLAWPTLVVCLGYPLYFWLRRATHTNHLGGLWFDMLLALPVSVHFILSGGEVVGAPGIESSSWVLGLGLLSALALVCQALSAPLLNLSLFGLLVYVEPLLLFLVALCLGESVGPGEWPTYIALWLAVAVLCLEGGLGWRNHRRAALTTQ